MLSVAAIGVSKSENPQVGRNAAKMRTAATNAAQDQPRPRLSSTGCLLPHWRIVRTAHRQLNSELRLGPNRSFHFSPLFLAARAPAGGLPARPGGLAPADPAVLTVSDASQNRVSG